MGLPQVVKLCQVVREDRETSEREEEKNVVFLFPVPETEEPRFYHVEEKE